MTNPNILGKLGSVSITKSMGSIKSGVITGAVTGAATGGLSLVKEILLNKAMGELEKTYTNEQKETLDKLDSSVSKLKIALVAMFLSMLLVVSATIYSLFIDTSTFYTFIVGIIALYAQYRIIKAGIVATVSGYVKFVMSLKDNVVTLSDEMQESYNKLYESVSCYMPLNKNEISSD